MCSSIRRARGGRSQVLEADDILQSRVFTDDSDTDTESKAEPEKAGKPESAGQSEEPDKGRKAEEPEAAPAPG